MLWCLMNVNRCFWCSCWNVTIWLNQSQSHIRGFVSNRSCKIPELRKRISFMLMLRNGERRMEFSAIPNNFKTKNLLQIVFEFGSAPVELLHESCTMRIPNGSHSYTNRNRCAQIACNTERKGLLIFNGEVTFVVMM